MRYVSLMFSVIVLALTLVVPPHAAAPEADPPVTVYDEQGNVVYSNELETQSEFLYKDFEQYTVTEGFLLLFLILAFCILIWRFVRGVF